MGFEVTFPGAFLAGLLSFVSPCILPLVPPYLCFLGGVSLKQLEDGDTTDRVAARRIKFSALAFVLGFATVFVAFGATASAIGEALAEYFDLLSTIAGIIIIVLGLHFIGLFRIGALFREMRFHPEKQPAGLIGAYIVGLAFAFGWTPCVGPVLATILFVAGTEDSVLYGAALLGTYAAGIGLPFMAAAFAAPLFLRYMRRIRHWMPWVERAIGVLLVATGILFITGAVNDIAYWLLETFPSLGVVG